MHWLNPKYHTRKCPISMSVIYNAACNRRVHGPIDGKGAEEDSAAAGRGIIANTPEGGRTMQRNNVSE